MKSKNINIFIADDESLIRMDLREILEENGYQVYGEAKSGLEVLELFSSGIPDLLIMDIKMPDLDGLETLQKLNHSLDYPKIPVIFLTAYGQPELIEQAAGLGVFAYLVKPIKENELLAAISVTLARAKEMNFIQNEVGKLKETLEVRKIVEKAKGILMNTKDWSESEAFRFIQKRSMDLRKSMKEVAENIISEDKNI